LLEASEFIRTIERRQGLQVGGPEEIAWRNDFINDAELEMLALGLGNTQYARYLLGLLKHR
jgi:glucose-1-phosphate thymidylyltransferase